MCSLLIADDPQSVHDGLDLLGALLPNHVMRGAAIGICMNCRDREAGVPNRQGLMPAAGQNQLFEERYPNGRLLICKRPLAKDAMNCRYWPLRSNQVE